MEPKEMTEIMAQFKEKFPNVEGLNISQMKKILDGELVMVPKSGTRKFVLMTPDDLKPGGKLDQMNAKIKAHNRAVRAENRAYRERGRKACRKFAEETGLTDMLEKFGWL